MPKINEVIYGYSAGNSVTFVTEGDADKSEFVNVVADDGAEAISVPIRISDLVDLVDKMRAA